jgi:predicted RNA-binding protein associated with RNAse of E/G family
VSSPPLVDIHYLRPPDRKEIFSQHLLHDDPEVKVTLARAVPFDPPIRIGGRIALEKGSDAVWFTFPGHWHDIGRFHRVDGTFTGLYSNILTPPRILEGGIWETTDLFLDVWVDAEGKLSILDEDQFQTALRQGLVTPQEAERALEEVEAIREGYERGSWPPAIVGEWTLERARKAMETR